MLGLSPSPSYLWAMVCCWLLNIWFTKLKFQCSWKEKKKENLRNRPVEQCMITGRESPLSSSWVWYTGKNRSSSDRCGSIGGAFFKKGKLTVWFRPGHLPRFPVHASRGLLKATHRCLFHVDVSFPLPLLQGRDGGGTERERKRHENIGYHLFKWKCEHLLWAAVQVGEVGDDFLHSGKIYC